MGVEGVGGDGRVGVSRSEGAYQPLRGIPRLVVHKPVLDRGTQDHGRHRVRDGDPREPESDPHDVVPSATAQPEGGWVSEGVEIVTLASRGIPEAVTDRIPVAGSICPPALDRGGERKVTLATTRDAGPARRAGIAAAAAVGFGVPQIDLAAVGGDSVAVCEACEAGEAAATRRARCERIRRHRTRCAGDPAGGRCVVTYARASTQVEAREAGEAAARGRAGGHRVGHLGTRVATGSAVSRAHLGVDTGRATGRLAGRAARRAHTRAAEGSRSAAGGAAASAVGGGVRETGLAARGRVAVAVTEARVAGHDGAGAPHAGGGSVHDGARAPAAPAVGEVCGDRGAPPRAGGLPRHGARRVRESVSDIRRRGVRVGAGVAHLRHIGVRHDVALIGRDVCVVVGEDVAVFPHGDVAFRRVRGRIERRLDVVHVHLVVARVGGRVIGQVRDRRAITAHGLEFLSAPR